MPSVKLMQRAKAISIKPVKVAVQRSLKPTINNKPNILSAKVAKYALVVANPLGKKR